MKVVCRSRYNIIISYFIHPKEGDVYRDGVQIIDLDQTVIWYSIWLW